MAQEQPVSLSGWRTCSWPVRDRFRSCSAACSRLCSRPSRTPAELGGDSPAPACARDRACFEHEHEHEHEHEQETVSRDGGWTTSGRTVTWSAILPATTGERDEAGRETRSGSLPGRPVRALFAPCSSACSSSCGGFRNGACAPRRPWQRLK